jgi:hypothetical protein
MVSDGKAAVAARFEQAARTFTQALRGDGRTPESASEAAPPAE